MRGRGRGGRRGQTERDRGSENSTREGSETDWKEVNPEIDTEHNTYTFSEHRGPNLALAKPVEFFNHFLGNQFLMIV